jgi:hypothetical protein
MALANNHREQLMKRLKRDIQLSIPSLVVADSPLSSGDPGIMLSVAGVDVAHVAIKRKSFNGFQVVAELSNSAAEGLPEHDAFLQLDTNAVGMDHNMSARIVHAVSKIGCASLKVIASTASPAPANAVDANVTAEIANDARLGAVGA